MSNIEITEGDTFRLIKDVDTDSAQCAVLDYPWQFDTDNGTDRFGHDSSTGDSELYDVQDEKGMGEILSELSRILEDGCWLFVFADDVTYPMFREQVEESDFVRRQTVYWDSLDWGMGYYHRVQVYPLVCATNGDTERYVQGRPNIYRAKHHSVSSEYHTAKPIDLYRKILDSPVIEKGETVIEPFAGTFPSSVPAREKGFSAIGFDIDERALSIARKRADGSGESSALDF